MLVLITATYNLPLCWVTAVGSEKYLLPVFIRAPGLQHLLPLIEALTSYQFENSILLTLLSTLLLYCARLKQNQKKNTTQRFCFDSTLPSVFLWAPQVFRGHPSISVDSLPACTQRGRWNPTLTVFLPALEYSSSEFSQRLGRQ